METSNKVTGKSVAKTDAKAAVTAKTHAVKPELKPLTEREKQGLFLIDKQSKAVPVVGTERFVGVRYPVAGIYFEGVKQSGAKVSVNLNRSGVVAQYGVSNEGQGIYSQPPFRLDTLEHAKGFVIRSQTDEGQAVDADKLTADQWKAVWSEYVRRVAKLETLDVSDSKHTVDYRNAYLRAVTNKEVSELIAESAKADGNVTELALSMIESNNATKGELQAKNRVIRETWKKLGKEQVAKNKAGSEATPSTVDTSALADVTAAAANAIAENATK